MLRLATTCGPRSTGRRFYSRRQTARRRRNNSSQNVWMSFPERRRRRKESIKALLPTAKTSWTQMKSFSRPQDVCQRQQEAVKRNLSSSLRRCGAFLSQHATSRRAHLQPHVTHPLQTDKLPPKCISGGRWGGGGGGSDAGATALTTTLHSNDGLETL